MIKDTYLNKKNEYELKEDIALLKLLKKDGSIINCKIDAEALDSAVEGGPWFAEWNRDFNSYLAMRYVQGEKHKEKQTLQSFIIGADPRTPVRHLNGDTLDNRKSNLEIYNRNAPNDYREGRDGAIVLILRDNYGKENGKAVIDRGDLSRVVNDQYTWVYYRKDEKPYAVANTPSGRIYLDRFIMNTPEDTIVHHINLNTLDNRKSNLENIEVEEETEE